MVLAVVNNSIERFKLTHFNKTLFLIELKRTYGKTCPLGYECNELAGLQCISSQCQCPSGMFFNGLSCGK